MVTILNTFHTGCFDPVPGSVEIHIFIFVIVVCLEWLPCSFVETTLVTRQAQNTEHARLAMLQPHLRVLYGVSLLQEHLTNFNKSSGASRVSLGSVVGIIILDPSSSHHPKAVGSIAGGSVTVHSSTLPPEGKARATFSLNVSFVGGRSQFWYPSHTLAQFVFPHFLVCPCQ